jgi:hypothetical protein
MKQGHNNAFVKRERRPQAGEPFPANESQQRAWNRVTYHRNANAAMSGLDGTSAAPSSRSTESSPPDGHLGFTMAQLAMHQPARRWGLDNPSSPCCRFANSGMGKCAEWRALRACGTWARLVQSLATLSGIPAGDYGRSAQSHLLRMPAGALNHREVDCGRLLAFDGMRSIPIRSSKS